jgi:hypothetical protein
MRDILPETFDRGLLGFTFEALPRACRLAVIAAQHTGDRRALGVIQRGIDLPVVSVVDVGPGFLGGPLQRAERRELNAGLDQGFEPRIDGIGQNIFAPGGVEQRTDKHTPAALAEGGDPEVMANLRHVPFSEPTLVVLSKQEVGREHPHGSGEMVDQARRQSVKEGERAQALTGLQEHHTAERGHGRFRRAVNKRQLVRRGGIDLLQFVVAEIGTDPRIRRLVNRRHRRARNAEYAKSGLCARGPFGDRAARE